MKSLKLARRQKINFLFIVILCCCLSISLLNFMTDPYGIMGNPVIPGFNKFKPEKADTYRLFKAVDIIRLKPRTVFLGTSTMDFGLDPNHPALAAYGPVYNLGMPGTNIYEIMRYFEHALYNQPDIKRVIISSDTFMFDKYRNNPKDYSDNRLQTNTLAYKDIFNATFSINAFVSSIKTIVVNLNNFKSEPYSTNGDRNENWLVENKPVVYRFIRAINRDLQDINTLSPQRFDYFKRIVELCRERNIDVKVFIPPIHATVTEGRFSKNKNLVTDEEKRLLVSIIPVWDFSGFNTITTEKVSNEMKYYIDAYHYRKNVGNLVLNRMLHFHEETVPRDFGVLMTPENIEAHLIQIQHQRAEWQKKHPELVKLVEDLEQVKGI
ncbi:hypothetical protein G7B40_008985 [Aetokthonos hydrillicola Thurmond2011]|jgi:hypothetical protein|uniref:Uncharacterized protein n=1 Tax=Aetokthonos hydrillicola Thurmond2011 TaxID=2712845 RepID=A0AAP5I6T2_9CYAN|nr:hypothetical protein [Aetokthonos hydrillicola]MBO3457616.1 hypothetical protein [Aetokthonos hydrillicola CCALA 1050]MBW4587894.1 hypothetical protein [Aetokthonos hydrillicola CCALA 1050]MDR9894702.1 hypothetical protein [Aetokthonos hydrillicola Thurmond2011]